MMKKIVCLGVIFFLFTSVELFALNTSVEFHSEILALYNFQPHTLNQQELDKKSSELDKFWSKVKGNQNKYLPLLRKELTNYKNPSFFLYDGSKLLLSLSKDIKDKQIALNAIPHCNSSDIQPTDYLLTVHYLAIEGLNTTEAAFHILDSPSFQAFIPQHALTLGQDYCLIYTLLPTSESYYLNEAVKRLKVEKNEEARKSLLLLLWYSVTVPGDQVVSMIVNDSKQSNNLRTFARQLQKKAMQIKPSVLSKISTDTYDLLKEKRRQIMKRISDEALMEFDDVTIKIRQRFNK